MPPPPSENQSATADGAWHPFNSRIEFDFAWYHFEEQESSARQLYTALELWAASVLEHGGTTPWRTPKDLHDTIDEIQLGISPWKSYSVRYQGPLPAGTPPKWMTQTYELCVRDARMVLHHQFQTPDFKDKINLVPYQQFNKAGKRVFSNLMSGEWAWRQAVSYHYFALSSNY
jgi:hypothetical protein